MKHEKTLNLAWRIPCALIVTATIAFVFMHMGGALMFTRGHPRNPAWGPPLAWIVIYGASTFLGVLAGSLRSKDRVTPIVVCAITVGTFIFLRYFRFSAAQRQHMREEAMFGIPSMIIAGAIACTVIIVLTRKTKQNDVTNMYRAILRRIWKIRVRLILLLIAAVGTLAVCDWHVASASEGLVYFDDTEIPAREIALVLGTAKYAQNGRTNQFYLPRIEAAANLFKAGKVRGIVVSGDNGRSGYDEPTQMKTDLIARGVPSEFITCDYAGFRTFDSVHRIERVFQESNYIVVSQEFHVRRALYIARDRGHNAIGMAVRTPGGYWGIKIRLREVLARAKAILDLHALKSDPKYLGDLEHVNKQPI